MLPAEHGADTGPLLSADEQRPPLMAQEAGIPNGATANEPPRRTAPDSCAPKGWQVVALITACIWAIQVDSMAFAQIGAFLPSYAIEEKGLSHTWMGIMLATQVACTLLMTLSAPALVRASSNSEIGRASC